MNRSYSCQGGCGASCDFATQYCNRCEERHARERSVVRVSDIFSEYEQVLAETEAAAAAVNTFQATGGPAARLVQLTDDYKLARDRSAALWDQYQDAIAAEGEEEEDDFGGPDEEDHGDEDLAASWEDL